MNHLHRRISLLLVSSICLMNAGCILERGVLTSFQDLTPRTYCPGDTLTASYDFQRELRCPAGVDCNPYHPTVTITPTPALFPTQSLPAAYTGSFNFPAAGDRVSVSFSADRASVLVPTEEFRDGARVFAQRSGYQNPDVRTSSLFNNEEQLVSNAGNCRNEYMPIQTWGPPQKSPQLIVSQVCNRDSVPIAFMAIDSSGRSTPEVNIEPGRCMPLPMTDVMRASRIMYRPLVLDVGARCMGSGVASPPDILARPLNVGVQYRCGP
jgi:hypothetical protein